MLEIVIAIAGSAAAGIWDLKTTEVPDEIPILMVAAGLFLWFITALNGNPTPFIISFIVGTSVLAFGLLLYRHGKWGGADAWVFAAILYLIPVYNNGIFLFDYLPNLILVSTVFTVIYALGLGVINKRVFAHFLADVTGNAAVVFGIPAAAAAAFASTAYVLFPDATLSPVANIFILLLLLTVFWRYARVIESRVFTKRIHVKQLKVGDVLQEMIWRGLTYEEVEKIKKRKKFVTIKEGMRFVPVFAITLAVTLLYGNLMFWLV